MDQAPKLKETNMPLLIKLFIWVKANLYLSLANVLATLIALYMTIEVIDGFIHYYQLELGALALPFVAWLDIMFIALVTSLFIRKPSGFTIFLGFVAILIVPLAGAEAVIGVLQDITGTPNFPSEATRQSIQGIVMWVFALVYIWDIVSRIRKARQHKTTS